MRAPRASLAPLAPRALLAPLAPLATAAALGMLALLGGCNKSESPKPRQDEAKAPTPVPSDMVFNDFLQPQGGGDLRVRTVDGGLLEGGLPSGGATDPAAQADVPGRLKVTEPGAEPRAARKYAFAVGKVDKRVFVLRNSVTQAGKTQEMPALAVSVDLTPKKVAAGRTTFELKVASVELADKDKVDKALVARAAQELGGFTGLTASFDVDAQGAIGELALTGSEKMQKQGAAELVESFQQAVELMLAPLPEEPIGVGAKWERPLDQPMQGMPVKGKQTFEAKELDATGGTIESSLEVHVAKRPLPDPRAPKGSTVQVDQTGTYSYVLKFDHIATKVRGEITKKATIGVPPGEGSKGESLIQEAKMRHSMDVAGAAGK